MPPNPSIYEDLRPTPEKITLFLRFLLYFRAKRHDTIYRMLAIEYNMIRNNKPQNICPDLAAIASSNSFMCGRGFFTSE